MIIIAIITASILKILFNIIQKQPHNVLTCGIFAWAGSNVSLFNADKFNILGMLNVERGKDSCGVSVDGDVFYGLQLRSRYEVFARTTRIMPEYFPVVIGHTRAASPGNLVTTDNAHPFLLKSDENAVDFDFTGCHNGTIYNKNILAKNNDIQINVKNVNNVSREKIDSEILLEALSKCDNNYQVLTEYNGAAAIVWSKFETPNIMYVFKGSSKKSEYSNYELEERPLHYYRESDSSIYISSLAEPLEVIGGVINETIFTFAENTIYIITDGDIDNAEQIKISRENSTQTKSWAPTSKYSFDYNSRSAYSDIYDTIDFDNVSNPDYVDAEIEQNLKNKRHQDESQSISPILNETKSLLKEVNEVFVNNSKILSNCLYWEKPVYPEDLVTNNKIYFSNLRYHIKQEMITGICIYINGFGFYKLNSYTEKQAIEEVQTLRNKLFTAGEFDKTHDILEEDPLFKEFRCNIPLTSYNNVELFYFIQGVRVKQVLDYTALFEEAIYKNHYYDDIDVIKLSHVAAHPIIPGCIATPALDYVVVLNGLPYTGNVVPLGSDRIYYFDKGVLLSTTYNVTSVQSKNNEKMHRSMLELLEQVGLTLLESAENLETIEQEKEDYLEQVKDLLDYVQEETVLLSEVYNAFKDKLKYQTDVRQFSKKINILKNLTRNLKK